MDHSNTEKELQKKYIKFAVYQEEFHAKLSEIFDFVIPGYMQCLCARAGDREQEIRKNHTERGTHFCTYNVSDNPGWWEKLQRYVQYGKMFTDEQLVGQQLMVSNSTDGSIMFIINDIVICVIQLNTWPYIAYCHQFYPDIYYLFEYLVSMLACSHPDQMGDIKKDEVLLLANAVPTPFEKQDLKRNILKISPFNKFISVKEMAPTGFWHFSCQYKIMDCKKLVYAFVSWLSVKDTVQKIKQILQKNYVFDVKFLKMFGKTICQKVSVYEVDMSDNRKLTFIVYCVYHFIPFVYYENGQVSTIIHCLLLGVQFMESLTTSMRGEEENSTAREKQERLSNIVFSLIANELVNISSKSAMPVFVQGSMSNPQYYLKTRQHNTIVINNNWQANEEAESDTVVAAIINTGDDIDNQFPIFDMISSKEVAAVSGNKNGEMDLKDCIDQLKDLLEEPPIIA